jgi:hypothetical protein
VFDEIWHSEIVGIGKTPHRIAAAGLAAACVLAAAPAQAQDASVLVLLAAPPLLLSPLLTGILRHLWIRRLVGAQPSLLSALALGVSEFVLWLLVAWFGAVVYFQEGWAAGPVLAALLAGVVALNRRLGPRRSWLLSAALAGVFPATWFVVQLVWYGLFVLRD